MDRRLLFPVAAATAWAQTASPEAAEAEKALRSRVDQFYQLQVDKKFRQADAFVAEDTKDLYFTAKKPEMLSCSIMKVELLEGNTRAKVTVKAKSMMSMIGVGRLAIEIPTVTLWKVENGQWVWYVDAQAPLTTPFGGVQAGAGAKPGGAPDFAAMMKSAPDAATLLNQVQIDQTAVVLTADKPVATVSISNNMPGYIEISVEQARDSAVLVEFDSPRIEAGARASVRLRRKGSKKVDETVHITVLPLNQILDIHVSGE